MTQLLVLTIDSPTAACRAADLGATLTSLEPSATVEAVPVCAGDLAIGSAPVTVAGRCDSSLLGGTSLPALAAALTPDELHLAAVMALLAQGVERGCRTVVVSPDVTPSADLIRRLTKGDMPCLRYTQDRSIFLAEPEAHAIITAIRDAWRHDILDEHAISNALASATLAGDARSLPSNHPAATVKWTEVFTWRLTSVGLDATMRRLYRRRLRDAVCDAGPHPPSPLDAPGDFLAWCRGSDVDGPVPVSRYLEEVRRGRSDLLDAFPEVPGFDSVDFLDWARLHGRVEVPIPDDLVPQPTATTPRPYLQAGVNLAGFLTAELGVGEVARRIATALDAASVPYSTVTFTSTASRTDHTFREDTPARFDMNIVCVNADSLGRFTSNVGRDFYRDRYTAGVWFWETNVLPDMFKPAFRALDEVWAASDYVATALEAAAPADVPVVRFPLPIVVPPTDDRLTRVDLGLPENRFVFLFSFDFLSVVERKNPRGLIQAFMRAFAPDEGPLLLLKSINGDRRCDELEQLRACAAGRRDVVVHDGYLDAIANATLLRLSDCFVSLHRSEGFGFNLADAIALGRPVIATGYSGNLTFMNDEDCYLVSSREVEIGGGHFPYPSDGLWADPDLDHAASLLRHVVEDVGTARTRARVARARVLRDFAPARTGTFVRDRFAGVRAERESRPPLEAAARHNAGGLPRVLRRWSRRAVTAWRSTAHGA